MLLSLLLPLALSQVVQEKNLAQLNKHHPHHHHHKHSSSSSDSSLSSSFYNDPNQVLELDAGFYPFNFGAGNAGQYAYSSFYIYSPVGFVLTITDCFCTGDAFMVYSFMDLLMTTNENCAINDNQCTEYSTDVLECLQGSWCKDTFIIPGGGVYNFTIKVMTSPYQAGTAFFAAQRYCVEENAPCCRAGPVDECNYDVVGWDSSSACEPVN